MSQRSPTDDETTKLASEYVQHGDQTRAFNEAFPNSKAKPDVIHVTASTLFSLPKVRLRIDQLQAISKEQSEKEFSMSVGELKEMLKKVMEQGIEEGKISATVAAIREMNCMDGNHSPLKTQEVNANELTPWSSVKASVDKLNE